MAGIDLPPDLSSGGLTMASLSKEERAAFWEKPLTGTSEMYAWLQAYEATVVALGARLSEANKDLGVSLQRENAALNKLAEATRLLEQARLFLNRDGRTWREIGHFLASL